MVILLNDRAGWRILLKEEKIACRQQIGAALAVADRSAAIWVFLRGRERDRKCA
ncbi:MAG: hypothetical protein KME26_07495 [Oscillatoria princeps RMCB-10]|jgi:hypothetical protein|nr:hypothetical protein [Oscillatoria princeps RMCB-10]